jgi:hypothetical protein
LLVHRWEVVDIAADDPSSSNVVDLGVLGAVKLLDAVGPELSFLFAAFIFIFILAATEETDIRPATDDDFTLPLGVVETCWKFPCVSNELAPFMRLSGQ